MAIARDSAPFENGHSSHKRADTATNRAWARCSADNRAYSERMRSDAVAPATLSLDVALQRLIDELDAMTSTPRTRELHKHAETYLSEIATWQAHPPTEYHRAAMRECVDDLARKIEHLRSGGITVPPQTSKVRRAR